MALFPKLFSKKTPTPPARPSTPVSHFVKSRVDGMTKQWYSINRNFLMSPNNEIRQNLQKTRELSRLLATVDPYAFKYLELLNVYVVGEIGFKLDPQVAFSDGTYDDTTNTAIKKAWNSWCDEASYDGRYTFNDLEALAIRTIARDGECFFRYITDPSVSYGFRLHPIDPNLIDITYNARLTNGNAIIMGIEFEGVRPVAYHAWTRYPDDLLGVPRERERIPASEVLHVFDDDYGSLTRGLPWLTPALKTLANLHEYADAHLLTAQIAASAPLVLSTDGASPESGPSYGDVGVNNGIDANDNTVATTPANEVINLNYNSILDLEAGKKLEALNLQFPQQAFESAMKSYLQAVASALQVSYSTLTSDGSQESFSSGRLGSTIERDHWKTVQKWFVNRFHKKVYRAFLETAMMSGQLDLPTAKPENYHSVTFRGRGFKYVDPVKDMNGYIMGLSHGLYTHEQICAEMGTDYEENIRQLAKEQKYAVENNVVLPDLKPKLDVITTLQAMLGGSQGQ